MAVTYLCVDKATLAFSADENIFEMVPKNATPFMLTYLTVSVRT